MRYETLGEAKPAAMGLLHRYGKDSRRTPQSVQLGAPLQQRAETGAQVDATSRRGLIHLFAVDDECAGIVMVS
ncbi:hypothetical protein PAGU2595_024050 [Lysobacter xanthus]